ncbi:MAG: hypothetical protein M1162_02545 [Candidatus Thermoplasmatota archaeon]|nr:hypothetical protein [Candidatus Thermoplasmatota archaeon]
MVDFANITSSTASSISVRAETNSMICFQNPLPETATEKLWCRALPREKFSTVTNGMKDTYVSMKEARKIFFQKLPV